MTKNGNQHGAPCLPSATLDQHYHRSKTRIPMTSQYMAPPTGKAGSQAMQRTYEQQRMMTDDYVTAGSQVMQRTHEQ